MRFCSVRKRFGTGFMTGVLSGKGRRVPHGCDRGSLSCSFRSFTARCMRAQGFLATARVEEKQRSGRHGRPDNVGSYSRQNPCLNSSRRFGVRRRVKIIRGSRYGLSISKLQPFVEHFVAAASVRIAIEAPTIARPTCRTSISGSQSGNYDKACSGA